MLAMDLVYAAVLGVVQGIAEFLPISSSGHLVIAEAILNSTTSVPLPAWLKGMTMNVALHFGTLLSITVVYFKDLLQAAKNLRLLMLVVIASIPIGFIGLAFKDQIEAAFDSTMAAGCWLLVTAAFLLIARRWQTGTTELSQMPVWAAWVIGVFQAIAILPGISRAGSTVASGLVCGLKRPDAARFSFFIAIPAIGGATFLELIKIMRGEVPMDVSWKPMLLGGVVSFVVGVLCLRMLIRLLVADRLHWFALYCLIVGGLTIIWQSGLFGI
jgi:undecaprenyl-diphosphatase